LLLLLLFCAIEDFIFLLLLYIYMNSNLYKTQFITFIVMTIMGMLFNPMNILAYRFTDLYLSINSILWWFINGFKYDMGSRDYSLFIDGTL